MSAEIIEKFTSVYGPVKSWRYGRSLGIDPIGPVSICSFNCVYCQLGEIERKIIDRAIYIPTERILQDLQNFAPWDVDVITLSGSGEPTLALNLAEILSWIKYVTKRLTLVLTNGTLLSDPEVRSALNLADRVSVKIDGISSDQIRRVNRPVAAVNLSEIWTNIQKFRQEYDGELGIQTMILTEWDMDTKAQYIEIMQALAPDEIQLNTPTRPKPVKRQLDGRENHTSSENRPYEVRSLKCVSANILQEFATEINRATGIPVRHAPIGD
ncbi:MAG TPA: radical SAM protein [Leptolyngbyaceae cyanobacterium]